MSENDYEDDFENQPREIEEMKELEEAVEDDIAEEKGSEMQVEEVKGGDNKVEEKLEIETTNLSPSNSPMKSTGKTDSSTGTDRKPMLYLSWDGEENSKDNVTKLKRFLRAKGYIIFEHAGDASISGGGGATTPTATATTIQEEEGKEGLEGNEGGGGGGDLDSARAKVSDEVTEKIKLCTVFVSCVTRKFTFNMHCKKLVLHCRKMVEVDRKHAPEMLYVMVHGDFTTESQPYHCRSGWLGYMLRDSLWSPAWSHAHISGAAEAIAGVIALRRNIIRLNPHHVLYIETRGKKGKAPPCSPH
jgi:hypothetical protein